MPDYLLHVQPAAAADKVREALPEVKWLADFVLGPADGVEVFSAPDLETAMRLTERLQAAVGVRAELVPLRSRW